MKTKRAAFTLIELLIVVAIIAILAAIAVPNFLEAQTRAKVSRAKADMRTIVTGLETYRIDNNKIPYMNNSARCIVPPNLAGNKGYERTLERLTSPISYLTGRATFTDPFVGKGVYEGVALSNTREGDQLPDPSSLKEYFYSTRDDNQHVQWGDNRTPVWYLLESSGPDRMHHYMGAPLNAMAANSAANKAYITRIIYDASNGTISRGSIWRVGGTPVGRGSVVAEVINSAN